jgi:hypothetical protein
MDIYSNCINVRISTYHNLKVKVKFFFFFESEGEGKVGGTFYQIKVKGSTG